MGSRASALIIKVSLLVRCPYFKGLNVCTLIQKGKSLTKPPITELQRYPSNTTITLVSMP